MKLVIDIPAGLKDSFNHEEQWTRLLCADMRDVLNKGIPYEETISAHEIAGQKELKRQDDLNNIKFVRGKGE